MLNHLKYLFLLIIFSACSSSEPEIDIVCEIDNTPDYILKWDISPVIEGNVKIYSSVDPQNFDTENGLIAECPISDENIRIHTNPTIARKYFLLRFDDKYDRIVGTRSQQFNFVQNFRDLGGYKNYDKKRIKWGMLYRSGKIDSLDNESIQRMKNLKIKTLIDFRDSQIFTLPPSSLKLENIIHMPISLYPLDMLEEKINNHEFKRGDACIFMQDLFIDLSKKATTTYKSMFNQLLMPENYPVVLTCSYGKDYTGFAVVLILSAMNIPEETILDDYLLTNQYLDKRSIDLNLVDFPLDIQEAVTALMTADEQYLNCAFKYIKRQYGSIQNYLEQELNMTPEKQKRLQEILLQ